MRSQPSVLSIEEEDDMVLHFAGGLVWVGFVEWDVRKALVASGFGWVRLGKVGLGEFFFLPVHEKVELLPS
jgi:hypothetical protein